MSKTNKTCNVRRTICRSMPWSANLDVFGRQLPLNRCNEGEGFVPFSPCVSVWFQGCLLVA